MADTRLALTGVAALLLAGCASEAAPEPERDAIACALGGAADLTEDCTVEKVREGGATVLVIHRPDGGFRRLTVLPSGGLIATDGADGAQVAESAEALTVTLAQDRYVVPRVLLVADAQ